jgi:hypothetical protein
VRCPYQQWCMRRRDGGDDVVVVFHCAVVDGKGEAAVRPRSGAVKSRGCAAPIGGYCRRGVAWGGWCGALMSPLPSLPHVRLLSTAAVCRSERRCERRLRDCVRAWKMCMRWRRR